MTYTIEDFLARSGAGPSSLDTYGRQLRQAQAWMDKPLGELSVRDVERLKAKLRTIRSGPQYAVLLRMFYKAAKREDLREILVLKQRLKRLKPADILSLKEVQAMIDSSGSARDKALLACLWECGVRVHELLALNLGNVRVQDSPENGGRKIYVLWFGKTKITGEEHEGYVIEAAKVLQAWLNSHPRPQPDSPLFPTYAGDRLGVDGALHVVQKAGRKAGIQKRVYNHLFRHSRATFLLASGKMSEAQVKVLLGWSPGSTMLSRYSHLVSRDAKKALFASLGMEPERIEIERLSFEDDRLKPVVPMIAPPGAKPAADETQSGIQELLQLAAKDATVEQALNLLLSAVRISGQAPPA